LNLENYARGLTSSGHEAAGTHLASAVNASSTLRPDRALVSMKGTPNSCTPQAEAMEQFCQTGVLARALMQFSSYFVFMFVSEGSDTNMIQMIQTWIIWDHSDF
jgi:hypothetical protein